MDNMLDIFENVDSVILIDAMNVLFKFHFGLHLSDSLGRKTGAIYGLCRMILSLGKKVKGAVIVLLWEGKNQFRRDKFAFYKAERKPTCQSIDKETIKNFKVVATLMGAYHIWCDGLEADDIAGCFAEKLKDKKLLLVSNDKDWWQFVSDSVKIMDSAGHVFEYADLWDELGFPPERVGLYKILVGDKTDGIRGITRFPHELAVQMVNACKQVDDFFSFQMSEKYIKWKKVLEENRDLISINSELILFQSDWLQGVSLSMVKPLENKGKLKSLLEGYNMRATLKTIFGGGL